MDGKNKSHYEEYKNSGKETRYAFEWYMKDWVDGRIRIIEKKNESLAKVSMVTAMAAIVISVLCLLHEFL